jgi:hypothetical protein
MPGFIYHVGAQAKCPHGGQITATASSRVTVNGQPVATVADPGVVAGCPFQVPAGPTTKPQPCVRVQWSVGATRVTADRKPVLIRSSTGICQSIEQIPQGPPSIVSTQFRVMAT